MKNLGSVSEARLGLAQRPSLREHGKFACSICHSQHELRKRTRKEWLNGLDQWLALVYVRKRAALVVLWDYRKAWQQKISHHRHIQLFRAEKQTKKKNKQKDLFKSGRWHFLNAAQATSLKSQLVKISEARLSFKYMTKESNCQTEWIPPSEMQCFTDINNW